MHVERVEKYVDNCLTVEAKTDTIRPASLVGFIPKDD